MAEIVLDLLGPAIELGKCIVAPVKRQFNYLCCFNKNIQKLSEEARELEEQRIWLQMEVDTAINNVQVVGANVESWLVEVNEIQEKKKQLDTKISNIQGGGFLFVKSRYSASKAAVKTGEAMKQKREDRRNITHSFHRPPPASVVPSILERSTSEFESRTKNEEDVMASLKDENVLIMGMCGMGGVGKTTLAEKIKNRVLKENVFGESLMVVVSQTVDKQKIQGEIAERLDLKFEETSLSGRAERLCKRLMGGKRILLVLDDVWEDLDLNELGIPCESGPQGCTILLTSRDKGVLTRMDAQPIYVIETLIQSEAWSLFKEKLGTCVDDQNEFSSLAADIADECKGLPLALVSVARELKDEKNISVWKDALEQLRSSNPEDLSRVLKDVYTRIKLSYDYLSSQNARSVFLLCCLFPKDFNIPLEMLFAYAIGLSMYEKGISKLEQARDKTVSLVEMLKRSFLLLEGQDEGYVRMHDVVRDVAIFIASKETQLIKHGHNSTWISPYVGERIELSNESTFPNLRLLMTRNFGMSGIYFEGMKGLNVLYVSYDHSSISLPTQFLKGLKTLILENCDKLKSLCDIGELINLEILICRDCKYLEELPSETMRLKRLRLLDIRYCRTVSSVVRCGATVVFPLLERIHLEDLKNLEEICDIDVPNSELSPSSSHNSFENLKELRIEKLPKLKRLWKTSSSIASLYNNLTSIIVYGCDRLVNLVPLSKARDCLPQLELLKICNCVMMEQVFLCKKRRRE